jgi:hypothetical protein
MGFSAPINLNSLTDPEVEVLSTYASSHGQPVLRSVEIGHQDLKLAIDFTDLGLAATITSGRREPVSIELAGPSLEKQHLTLMSLSFALVDALNSQKALPREFLVPLSNLLHRLPRPRAWAVAPVRTKPRRTYDQITDEFTPEGDHIPLVLARLLATTAAGRQRNDVETALEKFGQASGLYKAVRVRNLGKSASDPFQIQVSVAGRFFNLPDVGYGVSQALPVIVESALRPRGTLMLLQQPEVHLHPKAQAALGSFFIDLVAAQNRYFLIETHSDYLIDRVRQEVAAGKFDSARVRILFFERRGSESHIYPLTLDLHGDIEGAPSTYREFFLKEAEAFLRRSSS